MGMRRNFCLGVIFLAIMGINVTFPGIASADDLIVIANRSVPVALLTENEVKMIFLGKTKIWENGLKVNIVMQRDKEITERFLKHYVKQTPSKFNNYWEKQGFIGGDNPPLSFEREKDLVQYVSETRGAIGFINSKSYTDNLKILSVIH